MNQTFGKSKACITPLHLTDYYHHLQAFVLYANVTLLVKSTIQTVCLAERFYPVNATTIALTACLLTQKEHKDDAAMTQNATFEVFAARTVIEFAILTISGIPHRPKTYGE